MKNILLLFIFTFCYYFLPAQFCVFDESDFGKGQDYAALKAIYNANPDNTLNWDLSDCEVCNWEGVTCVSGRVFKLSIPGKKISVLPPEISGLTEMEILNLFNNQLSDLPAEMGSLTRLNDLSLNGNQFSNLPPVIGSLSGLSSLGLHSNQLSTLPAEIGNLSNLNFLALYSNQFSTVPPVIWSLTGLRVLYLFDNQLTSLPPGVGNLTNLGSLVLNDNQLSTLPPEIENLANLTYLGLNNNQLTSLPAEIGNLSSILSFICNNNQLKELPPEIGNLQTMTGLQLGNNLLESLPAEIGNLSGLIQLSLSNNQLNCLPEEMTNLCSNNNITVTLTGNPFPYTWDQFCLEGLGACCPNPDYEALAAIYNANPDNILNWDLSDCDVCNWEGVFCDDFGRVTRLLLDSKNLTILPLEIGQLTSLTALVLRNNQLTNVPVEIGQLTSLTDLGLQKNQLTDLPVEIGQLTNLTDLRLEDNQLTGLPVEIGQLTSLTYLDLSRNQLNSLPVEIGQLTSLTTLGLLNNQLTSLPTEIGQLANLEILPLSYNQLTSLPPEIGQLSSIQFLWVGFNQLTSLPPEIGQLSGVIDLFVMNNQLTSLPPEIGQIDVDYLILDNNQLTCLPTEMRNLCGKNVSLAGNPFPYSWEQFCSVGLGSCCDNPEYDVLTAIYLANPGNTLNWDFSDCEVCNWDGITCNSSGRIEILNLFSKNLSSLPPELSQLTNLINLSLPSNQLSSLPPEIGQLSSLVYLVLSNNQLSSLPPEIGQLSSLSNLSLNRNQLSSLPPEIGQLTSLINLNLYENQLNSLPSEVGQLTNLMSLEIFTNQLTSLPPEIGQLTKLTSMQFFGNQLISLPPEIGQLTNLTGLIGYNNQLTELPPEIGQLVNITSLQLFNNQLTCLPEEMTNLCNNTDLFVSLFGNPFPFDWELFCSEGLGRCCDFPEMVSCSDINVNLDETGTYELTPQVVTDFNTTVDPCVYDLLQVSPSILTCEDLNATSTSYQLLYTPGDGTETFLCFGRVQVNDKLFPWFTSCPSSQYINLEPNTELTLTPADLGVTAADNCAVSLTTDPDPFTITSADNGSTLDVTVFATDEAGRRSSCTVAVTVSVSNCSSGADAPDNLAVEVTDTDVVLSWDPVGEATVYNTAMEVYVIKKGKGKWKAVNGIPPTVEGASLVIPSADLDFFATYRFTVSVSGGGINCKSVIEFTPIEYANSDFQSLPSTRLQQAITPSLRIFPNPVRDRLHITFGQALDQARRLRLVDLHGRSLRELVVSPGESTVQVDVSRLPAGMYALHVSGGTDKQLHKVVISR